MSLSLFTQPSNRGQILHDQHHPTWTTTEQIEVNIAGLLHFYIQWYSSKWDRNALLLWIFLIIATKASQLEKRCAIKAFSSATSWSFSEEHLAFFSWLKTLWWTHSGGKSTKIFYSSKSTITLMKFYLSTSKSTSLKIYSSKSKK